MPLTESGGALTTAHSVAQAALAAQVAAAMRTTWDLLDPTNISESVERWLAATVPVVMEGRQRSSALAGAYLTAFAAAEIGAEVAAPVAASGAATVQQVTTSLRVTGPTGILARSSTGMPVARSSQLSLQGVMGSSARQTLSGGRETLHAAIDGDGRIVGYARVLRGTRNCAFCAMLASRGPMYKSEGNARDVRAIAGNKYHDDCDCEPEPVFSRSGYRSPNDADRQAQLEDLWAASTLGYSGKDARNAFARAYRAAS